MTMQLSPTIVSLGMAIITHVLPPLITTIGGVLIIIRQTNNKTEKEAAITNTKVEQNTKTVTTHVDEVKDNVIEMKQNTDGNYEDIRSRLVEALARIEMMHAEKTATAVQTEVDKATVVASQTQVDKDVALKLVTADKKIPTSPEKKP